MLPDTMTESLAVLAMFVVRIGIPVAITLVLGWWLEKKLRPPDADQNGKIVRLDTARHAKSSKVIQLHCWNMKHCDSAKVAQCAAYKHPELPCWLALQVEGGKVREECFTCALYKPEQLAA